jgi:hypothetical protein
MSSDLNDLFGDTGLDNCPELSSSIRSSSPCPSNTSGDRKPDDDDEGLSDLMGGVQLMMNQDPITALMDERDKWRNRTNESAKRIAVLEKRMASKSITGLPLGSDLKARLDHLERENERLKREKLRVEEELQATKMQNASLCNDNDGKSRKLKGANKKVKNAKDVAVKEEEKAKEAAHERDQRLKQQREQQRKLKTAQAEVASKEKIIQRRLFRNFNRILIWSELDTRT